MKITIKHYDEVVSIEVTHDDVNGEEMQELLKRVLLAVGFHPDTVKRIFNEEEK